MNKTDKLVKKLFLITDNLPYKEYYSHVASDCFKIDNEFTNYKNDKIVLCPVHEGYTKAIQIAINVIGEKKKEFYRGKQAAN